MIPMLKPIFSLQFQAEQQLLNTSTSLFSAPSHCATTVLTFKCHNQSVQDSLLLIRVLTQNLSLHNLHSASAYLKLDISENSFSVRVVRCWK